MVWLIVHFMGTVLLILLGCFLSLRVKGIRVKWALGLLFFTLCIPSMLSYFQSVYTGITSKRVIWILELQSTQGFEFLSSFWGLLIGFITIKNASSSKVRWKMFNKYFYVIAVIAAVFPLFHSGGIPTDTSKMSDMWDDEICLQSTDYTCGPSSLATVLRYYGIHITEKEAAKAVHTGKTGTEEYQILRFLHKKGFSYQYVYQKDLSRIQCPAILDVKVEGIAHAIVLLKTQNGVHTIGDPLYGKQLLKSEEFYRHYQFHGLALEIFKQ